MAEPDFQPYRRTIEELLAGTDYFLIPRFQRPYSWDRGNLEEFWSDVIEDNSVGYFIGPMVAWRKSSTSPLLYVVDGQQRLMTLTMLLASIRNAFRRLNFVDLAEGANKFIEKADRNNELHFVIQPEVGSSFVNNRILSEDASPPMRPTTDEERALETAFQDITEKVSKIIDGKSVPMARKTLINIRDKVLGLRIIWIEHRNEDDAYVVFETLNSRGKDLEVVDLLKNHLLNLLRSKGNVSADSYRDQWTRMRLSLQESQVSIDANRFVLHWWLSQEKYVAQKKLFQAVKKSTKTKTQAATRLQQLEDDAPLYKTIYEPASSTWTMEEMQMPSSLEALNIFDVVQPAPILLALLRARRDRMTTLKQILATLKTIERFHFQLTAIAKLSSSGGISEMYAKYARELTNSERPNVRGDWLKQLRESLAKRMPEEDVFKTSFVARLLLTDENTREKKLVQYVLRRTAEYTNPKTRLDNGTVEHLLSQDQIGEFDASIVGNIGNLLWLPEDLNGQLGNKTFVQKKRILARHSSHYDIEDVLSSKEWGPAEIELRANRLAELARNAVWKLPL